MSLGRQITIVLLILLAVAGVGYWYATDLPGGNDAGAATRPTRSPALVEVARVERTTLIQQIDAVGTTLARRAVDIRPATSGQVVEIAFSPGSVIDTGTLLVRLDDAAERADVAEAAAELRRAELELERAIKLMAKRTIAQATVDQLEATQQAAEARLLRAEKALRDREVKAPFAGQVGLKQVTIGTRVDDETVITTLDDLAEIQIEFSVPEIFFAKVRPNQRINATGTAFGDRIFEGLIEVVDSRIDRTSRSFKVRAKLPNPDFVLPAGMFMAVDLILEEREALTVPEEAVTVANDETYIFVVVDGKAERRQIVLGQRSFGEVEITDGVEYGAKVVTKGLQRVRDGAAVEVSGENDLQEENSDDKSLEAADPSA